MKYSRIHRPHAIFEYRVKVGYILQGKRMSNNLYVKASNSVNAGHKAIALVANVKGCAHRVESFKSVGAV